VWWDVNFKEDPALQELSVEAKLARRPASWRWGRVVSHQ
jgi:hypothetical protein